MSDEPIHHWFGLTYATYLVIPRSVLQSAPVEWQRKLVAVLEEADEFIKIKIPLDGEYNVLVRDSKGKFKSDFYKEYERGRRIINLKEQDDERV